MPIYMLMFLEKEQVIDYQYFKPLPIADASSSRRNAKADRTVPPYIHQDNTTSVPSPSASDRCCAAMSRRHFDSPHDGQSCHLAISHRAASCLASHPSAQSSAPPTIPSPHATHTSPPRQNSTTPTAAMSFAA